MPHDLKSTNQESSDDEAFTAGDGIYDEELSIKILTIKIVGSNVLNDDGGSYAAYNIATTLSNGQLWNVWRRYSEFVSFHSELKKEGVTGRPALPGSTSHLLDPCGCRATADAITRLKGS